MIRSERQLANAYRRIDELNESIADADDEATVDTLSALIEDLRSQISCFESIKSGIVRVFGLSSLDDLGNSIIKARLAKGWTQRQLADALGVSEQMVQKDESRGYESAGIARLADILDILGYELVGSVRPILESRKPSLQEFQNGFFDLIEGSIPGRSSSNEGVSIGPSSQHYYPVSNSLLVGAGISASASLSQPVFGEIRVLA